MKRRSFLQALVAMGTASAMRSTATSTPVNTTDDPFGVLVDLSACEGCQSCEFACAEANGLPEPEEVDVDEAGLRTTSERQRVAVSRHETSRGDIYVCRQCMHCLEPACAAGCLTKALYKTPEGPVIWRGDKCMGCRYCMISCPFDVPKFEYASSNPEIVKCQMCYDKITEGEVPAVDECPNEAMTFGHRSELLQIARTRISEEPEYVSHIYGEHEAGGTGWLYISKVDFAELGFPMTLGETAYPELTRDFLTAVPVVIGLWPMALLGLRNAIGPKEASE